MLPLAGTCGGAADDGGQDFRWSGAAIWERCTPPAVAEISHDVLGVDIDEDKMTLLNSSKAWFYEPGPDEMLVRHIASGRLRFTASDACQGIDAGGWRIAGWKVLSLTGEAWRGEKLLIARRRSSFGSVETPSRV